MDKKLIISGIILLFGIILSLVLIKNTGILVSGVIISVILSVVVYFIIQYAEEKSKKEDFKIYPDYEKLGDGYCRTVSGGSGTSERVGASDLDNCRTLCNEQSDCVAFEYNSNNNMNCELHTEEITNFEPIDNVYCYKKKQRVSSYTKSDKTISDDIVVIHSQNLEPITLDFYKDSGIYYNEPKRSNTALSGYVSFNYPIDDVTDLNDKDYLNILYPGGISSDSEAVDALIIKKESSYTQKVTFAEVARKSQYDDYEERNVVDVLKYFFIEKKYKGKRLTYNTPQSSLTRINIIYDIYPKPKEIGHFLITGQDDISYNTQHKNNIMFNITTRRGIPATGTLNLYPINQDTNIKLWDTNEDQIIYDEEEINGTYSPTIINEPTVDRLSVNFKDQKLYVEHIDDKIHSKINDFIVNFHPNNYDINDEYNSFIIKFKVTVDFENLSRGNEKVSLLDTGNKVMITYGNKQYQDGTQITKFTEKISFKQKIGIMWKKKINVTIQPIIQYYNLSNMENLEINNSMEKENKVSINLDQGNIYFQNKSNIYSKLSKDDNTSSDETNTSTDIFLTKAKVIAFLKSGKTEVDIQKINECTEIQPDEFNFDNYDTWDIDDRELLRNIDLSMCDLSNISSIGDRAFKKCHKLKLLAGFKGNNSKLTFIGDDAFNLDDRESEYEILDYYDPCGKGKEITSEAECKDSVRYLKSTNEINEETLGKVKDATSVGDTSSVAGQSYKWTYAYKGCNFYNWKDQHFVWYHDEETTSRMSGKHFRICKKVAYYGPSKDDPNIILFNNIGEDELTLKGNNFFSNLKNTFWGLRTIDNKNINLILDFVPGSEGDPHSGLSPIEYPRRPQDHVNSYDITKGINLSYLNLSNKEEIINNLNLEIYESYKIKQLWYENKEADIEDSELKNYIKEEKTNGDGILKGLTPGKVIFYEMMNRTTEPLIKDSLKEAAKKLYDECNIVFDEVFKNVEFPLTDNSLDFGKNIKYICKEAFKHSSPPSDSESDSSNFTFDGTNLKYIAESAFENINLEIINLGYNLKVIEDNAFKSNTNLHLKSNNLIDLKKIGVQAFGNTSGNVELRGLSDTLLGNTSDENTNGINSTSYQFYNFKGTLNLYGNITKGKDNLQHLLNKIHQDSSSNIIVCIEGSGINKDEEIEYTVINDGGDITTKTITNMINQGCSSKNANFRKTLFTYDLNYIDESDMSFSGDDGEPKFFEKKEENPIPLTKEKYKEYNNIYKDLLKLKSHEEFSLTNEQRMAEYKNKIKNYEQKLEDLLKCNYIPDSEFEGTTEITDIIIDKHDDLFSHEEEFIEDLSDVYYKLKYSYSELKYIGNSAFKSESINSIKITHLPFLERIGNFVFNGNETNIIFQSIGLHLDDSGNSFDNQDNLTIKFQSKNSNNKNLDYCNYLFYSLEKDPTSEEIYRKYLKECTAIKEEAFYKYPGVVELDDITLTNIISIGKNAFNGANGSINFISEKDISEKEIKIYDRAFMNFKGKINFTFINRITSKKPISLFLYQECFKNCDNKDNNINLKFLNILFSSTSTTSVKEHFYNYKGNLVLNASKFWENPGWGVEGITSKDSPVSPKIFNAKGLDKLNIKLIVNKYPSYFTVGQSSIDGIYFEPVSYAINFENNVYQYSEDIFSESGESGEPLTLKLYDLYREYPSNSEIKSKLEACNYVPLGEFIHYKYPIDLTNVDLSNIQYLGNDCFSTEQDLSINIGNENQNIKLKKIYANAFSNRVNKVKRITIQGIANNLSLIDIYAFYSLSSTSSSITLNLNLRELTNFKKINYQAFLGHSNTLSSITLTGLNNLTLIGTYAFYQFPGKLNIQGNNLKKTIFQDYCFETCNNEQNNISFTNCDLMEFETFVFYQCNGTINIESTITPNMTENIEYIVKPGAFRNSGNKESKIKMNISKFDSVNINFGAFYSFKGIIDINIVDIKNNIVIEGYAFRDIQNKNSNITLHLTKNLPTDKTNRFLILETASLYEYKGRLNINKFLPNILDKELKCFKPNNSKHSPTETSYNMAESSVCLVVPDSHKQIQSSFDGMCKNYVTDEFKFDEINDEKFNNVFSSLKNVKIKLNFSDFFGNSSVDDLEIRRKIESITIHLNYDLKKTITDSLQPGKLKQQMTISNIFEFDDQHYIMSNFDESVDQSIIDDLRYENKAIFHALLTLDNLTTSKIKIKKPDIKRPKIKVHLPTIEQSCLIFHNRDDILYIVKNQKYDNLYLRIFNDKKKTSILKYNVDDELISKRINIINSNKIYKVENLSKIINDNFNIDDNTFTIKLYDGDESTNEEIELERNTHIKSTETSYNSIETDTDTDMEVELSDYQFPAIYRNLGEKIRNLGEKIDQKSQNRMTNTLRKSVKELIAQEYKLNFKSKKK